MPVARDQIGDQHASEKGRGAPARKDKTVKDLVKVIGGRFSSALGIHLSSGNPREIFKWFLAAILFGARISEAIVIRTYREFEGEGVLSAGGVLDKGWDGLVEVLDRGGYARYDFKTATKLLDICSAVMKRYQGDLNILHSGARDPRDLEERLKALGKGIGDTTVNIFLREMRGIWGKADPPPSDLVVMAAKNLRLIPSDLPDRKEILGRLKKKWTCEGMKMNDFPDFEAALLRLAKNFCRRTACGRCPLQEDCGVEGRT
jgi:endonuclease III